MGKTHKYTKFHRARDELMSHVVRCDVLDAAMDHRREWLDETMDYMAERYPMLGEMQLAKLEMVGRQFIKPPIPHGKGHSAVTRDRRLQERLDSGDDLAEPVATEDTTVEVGELQAA